MEKYESKQCQIFKSAAQIYPFISNFSLLTPAVADKVEEWNATEDTCSFKVKGFTVKLRMVLHCELNMMMRMMIGGKIQKGLDQAVETFAQAFNRF